MASDCGSGINTEKGFDTTSRPVNALLEGVKLLTNLEETHHFFKIFDSVDGKQNELNYQRYLASDIGAKMDREGVNFADILSDREYLQSFPVESLAHSYLQFLEQENLSLELLMNAENQAESSALTVDQSRRNFAASGIATHDLLHVVTGYHRDPIGEACLLAFTAEQFDLKGVGAFAHALAVREQIRFPKSRVLAFVKEAKKRAKECVWLAEVDWREQLQYPLENVRNNLKLRPPALYQAQKWERIRKNPASANVDIEQNAA